MSEYEQPKKTCSKCREEKPLWEFSRNKGSHDGLASRCKACVKIARGDSEVEIVRKHSMLYGFSKRPNS